MDDPLLVGFGQARGDLPAQRNGRSDRQGLRPVEEALEVLPPDILHGQVERPAFLAQVVGPADVRVADLAGVPDLVVEAFDRSLVDGDLRLDEFEGHFFVEFSVVGPVDLAHPPRTELLDDLVAAGEDRPPHELVGGRLERPGEGSFRPGDRSQLSPAIRAIGFGLRIFLVALRTPHRLPSAASREESNLAKDY
ncbi:MAG: hypothetical protein WCC00_15005 [Candidatus Aminicenantales bacterium]